MLVSEPHLLLEQRTALKADDGFLFGGVLARTTTEDSGTEPRAKGRPPKERGSVAERTPRQKVSNIVRRK
jgi:hypothetical protein